MSDEEMAIGLRDALVDGMVRAALMQSLGSVDLESRRNAVVRLGELAHLPAVPLLGRLARTDADLRDDALQALGRIGHSTLPEFAGLLVGDDESIARSAFEALTLTGLSPSRVLPALCTAAKRADLSRSNQEVMALCDVATKVTLLMRFDLDGVRAFLDEMTPWMEETRVIFGLVLAHPSSLNRIIAAHALWMLDGDKRGVDALLEVIANKEDPQRPLAQQLLTAMGHHVREPAPDEADERSSFERILPNILGPLREPGSHETSHALALTRRLWYEGWQPTALSRAVLDLACADGPHRCHALSVLGTLGADCPGVVELLCAALKDEDARIRKTSAESLASCGTEAARALPELLAARGDTDPAVKAEVERAVEMVRRTAVPPKRRRERTTLFSDLHSRDSNTRFEALVEVGPESASDDILRAVFDCLGDDDWRLKHGAATAFGRIGGAAVPFLLPKLGSPDPQVREHAVEAVTAIGPAAAPATAALIRMLEDETLRPSDNGHACRRALCAIGPSARPHVFALLLRRPTWDTASHLKDMAATVDEFIPHLRHPDVEVRRQVLAVLRYYDAMKDLGERIGMLVEAALPLLDDPDAVVRKGALDVLPVREHPSDEKLLSLLDDPNADVRSSALTHILIRKSMPDVMLPRLRAMLDGDDHDEWKGAIEALKAYGEKSAAAVPRLFELLGSDYESISNPTYWALAEIKVGVAERAATMIETAEPPLRQTLSNLLAELKADALPALPILSGLLSSPDPWLRREGARPIIAMGEAGSAALPALLAAAFDDRDDTPESPENGIEARSMALKTLAALGPTAASAVPRLETLFDDPHLGLDAAKAVHAISGSMEPLIRAHRRDLDSDSPYARLDACDALLQLGVEDEQVRRTVIDLANDSRADQERALMLLPTIKPVSHDALMTFVDQLLNSHRHTREAAESALHDILRDEIDHWTARLSSPDVSIRLEAVRAVGDVVHLERGVEWLSQASRDPDADVRRAALESLIRLGTWVVDQPGEAARSWTRRIGATVAELSGDVDVSIREAVAAALPLLAEREDHVTVAPAPEDEPIAPPEVDLASDWLEEVEERLRRRKE